ncbi:hypothetical protein [Frankia sp. CiP1_Cm_nod2]|uniref:hypothetical protein n=1 Tax=Frankia sp. CiP1_Cm_nod2 TaxID=2897161 RepID=UPI0020242E06
MRHLPDGPLARVALRHGLWCAGSRHTTAVARPLDGRDEAYLAEHAHGLDIASRVSTLLARCLVRLGDLTEADMAEVDEDTVDGLTVGDREVLLLHLRRLTFGDQLSAVVTCPDPDCGEPMDLDLRVGDLLPAPGSSRPDLPAPDPPAPDLPGTGRVTPGPAGPEADWYLIDVPGVARPVRFRLPTGADQRAAAALADRPDAAAAALLGRCVPTTPELPPAGADAVAAAMAELDPHAEIVLKLDCPRCQAAFATVLDTGAFLLAEVSGRMGRLYQEVHLLAYHYHWSEREIMSMTARTRARYLDLLDAELSRGYL